MKKTLPLLALLLSFSPLHAKTQFVTDHFKITMRSGESATHKIIRMLPSGYPLEVISKNTDTGYSQVKTKDGETGFVLTRQLIDEPSARDRLIAANKRLTELQQEPGRLSSQLASLQDKHQDLTQKHAALSKNKKDLEQQLENIQRTASNAIKVTNERNQLRQQMVTLTHQLEELKQENRELSNDSAQRWFMIGGGVVTGGILLGLILPSLSMRKRRKSSWSSL